MLDIAAERGRLEEALRPHLERGLIELDWLDDASWAGIHTKLLEQEWHVLHFIGHGTYDTETDEGMLAFVGADGRADLVPANALADLLDEAEPTPRLVVLNSCQSGAAGGSDLFSGTAAALAHSGIHAVAAMQFSISDAAAIAFARGFYTALAHGRDVDEAVRSGRIEILGTGRGTLEWVTPVLYLRGEDAQLFSVAPAPTSAEREVARRPARAGLATTAQPAKRADAARTTDAAASRRRVRPWMPWVGITGLAVIGTTAALIATQPWSTGGGGSDDSGSDGSSSEQSIGEGWGEPVSGIAGTERTEGTVPADALEYTNTGMWCNQGGRLDITASGEILPSASGPAVGPDGLANGESPESRIIEDANTAALIGKLEDTDEPAFEIGEQANYECPVPGTLFLGLNDTSVDDNEGEFRVVVTYVPPQ